MKGSILKQKPFWILALAVIAISAIVACGKSDDWCVGKWTGSLKTQMHEEYVIRIREDHTCSIKAKWFSGGTRSAEYEGEWEPVSDNVIKIFDYDGHFEIWSNGFGTKQMYVQRWSMYLRKDGAFNPAEAGLNNPLGYLKKQ